MLPLTGFRGGGSKDFAELIGNWDLQSVFYFQDFTRQLGFVQFLSMSASWKEGGKVCRRLAQLHDTYLPS
jgi:hypothetical protein